MPRDGKVNGGLGKWDVLQSEPGVGFSSNNFNNNLSNRFGIELLFAKKLQELYPNQKIILADAQLAGEGASSRNSGYLVDTTLNDGFTSNKDLENYKIKTDIYKLGINFVKKFMSQTIIQEMKIQKKYELKF